MFPRILLTLSVWFIGVFLAAQAGVFINVPGKPPAGIGLAFATPLILFLVLFFSWPRFRQSLTTLSPILLATLHVSRFVGLGFIMAYYQGLLPPSFAWPAGLGDIAVAALAPYMVHRLLIDPQWLRSRWFLAWNIFGVIDFLGAVGLGVAHQIVPAFVNAGVSTRLMQELPFVLIPCFFVPLLGITHIIMLHQACRPRHTEMTAPWTGNPPLAAQT